MTKDIKSVYFKKSLGLRGYIEIHKIDVFSHKDYSFEYDVYLVHATKFYPIVKDIEVAISIRP